MSGGNGSEMHESGKDEAQARLPSKGACPGFSKSGTPCQANPMADGWCFFHSPNVPQEEKDAAVMRGGLASRRSFLPADTPTPSIQTPGEAVALLEETAGQVRRGEIAPAVGNAVGFLVGTALRAMEISISDKLDRLERRVKEIHGRRP